MTCGILSHPRLGPLSEGSAGEPSLEQHGLGVLVQSYIPEVALEAAEESHRRPEGDLSGDRHVSSGGVGSKPSSASVT